MLSSSTNLCTSLPHLVAEVDDFGGDRVDLLVERLVREGRSAVPLDQRRHALPVRLLLVPARLCKEEKDAENSDFGGKCEILNKGIYRVGHLLADLGWVDLDL